MPERLKAPDGFVDLASQRLEYAYLPPPENGDGTVLVFLHEGLGCVEMWRDFPARLAQRTACGYFIFSRLGYGRSDPVALPRRPSFMHEEALGTLPRLLEHCEFSRCVLVGHSDGATIALLNAALAPARELTGVAVMAPHVFVEPVTVQAIEQAANAYRETNLRARLARYHGERVDGAFWGWNQVWRDASFANWNIESELKSVNVPLLLVQGHDDAYGTMAQLDRIERRVSVPVQRVELENCGHSPFRERVELTLEHLARFIHALR
jgi:pimeloyl-ACP methyl ester carboxylesterase